MRTTEELGSIMFNERANEAYRTYASLYLDCVDDNMNHFLWRDVDIRPLRGMDAPTDDEVFTAYMHHAVDIAKHAMSCGAFATFELLYEEYPLLKEFSAELEYEFYGPDDRSLDEIKNIVKKAFELQDWIEGCETGGTEPPRNILSIEEEIPETGTVKITVKYDLPETAGCWIDCRYTVIDPHKVRESVFLYKNNSLSCNGGKAFSDDLWLDEEKEMVEKFYQETGLSKNEITE